MADRLAELVDVRLASAGVALVTLNLPQLRNAMTTELTAAWTTAMDNVAGDRSLRAVGMPRAREMLSTGRVVADVGGEFRKVAMRNAVAPAFDARRVGKEPLAGP